MRFTRGRAVQVDPGYPVVFAVDPTLAFRHFQLLKKKCDKLVSNFAINFNLCHYSKGAGAGAGAGGEHTKRNTAAAGTRVAGSYASAWSVKVTTGSI